jgi:hypothetical protein
MRKHRISYYGLISLLLIAFISCTQEEWEQEIMGTSVDNTSTRSELIEYTIHVDTAGTLDSLVQAGSYSDAQKLIVTGNIAYEDVNYVDANMTTVEVLDLSGATYESKSISGVFLSDSTQIKEISLPGNITSISGWSDSGPFYYCSSLTSITIPQGVTSIGYRAFEGCSSLTSITIPQGVTSIGRYAFHDCSSLNSITIPESVTSIESYAFYGCSSLTSITIPESVTSIESYAFYGCDSLRIIIWNTSCSITDYLSLRGRLVLYGTEDTTSAEGNDITTAKQAIYTKSFYNEWYTIALPFKPTQITHKTKGTIAPFDSGVEGAKNFWLRELTTNGYQDVTEIEAGHAYIIAMPTSNSYAEEFRLGGQVTFSAENVTIDWRTIESKGSTYTMYPTYETVKKSMDVYALNSEYWVKGYDYGHVWVRGAMDVEPYQAYVKLNDGSTTRSVIPITNGTRATVRGASSTSGTSTRGVSVQRKPKKEDM